MKLQSIQICHENSSSTVLLLQTILQILQKVFSLLSSLVSFVFFFYHTSLYLRTHIRNYTCVLTSSSLIFRVNWFSAFTFWCALSVLCSTVYYTTCHKIETSTNTVHHACLYVRTIKISGLTVNLSEIWNGLFKI